MKTCDLSSSSVGQLEQSLSQIDLNGSSLVCEGEERGLSTVSNLTIYKITSRTRIEIVNRTAWEGRLKGNGDERAPSFLQVGGAKKQIELLKEIILYPLSPNVDSRGMCITIPFWGFMRCAYYSLAGIHEMCIELDSLMSL